MMAMALAALVASTRPRASSYVDNEADSLAALGSYALNYTPASVLTIMNLLGLEEGESVLTASNFRECFAKVGLGSRERKKESWAILKESLTRA